MTPDTTEIQKTAGRRLLILIAAFGIATAGWFLLGESESVIAAEPKTAGAKADSKAGAKVLATVNGKAITEEEVLDEAAGQLLALDRQRHQLISTVLDTQIHDLLVELEAQKRGISQEELLKTEIDDKAATLPAEQVDAFYDQQNKQRRGQLPPKDQIEQQMREYLAYQDFSERLRAAAKIEKKLEPFRIEVAATGPKKGPDGAPVTIIEFSDFECPFCNRVVPTLDQVAKTYGDKVQIVFRQFPLSAIHPNAMRAGEASLCAGEQGKFWQLHDAMFADQSKLEGDGLQELAKSVEGLDVEALEACIESDKYVPQIERDLAEGQAAGVTGTPAFFINGRFMNGALTFEQLKAVIDEELGG